MPKYSLKKAIWCDHCNADIHPSGIKACLRWDCKTKAKLDDASQQREKATA